MEIAKFALGQGQANLNNFLSAGRLRHRDQYSDDDRRDDAENTHLTGLVITRTGGHQPTALPPRRRAVQFPPSNVG